MIKTSYLHFICFRHVKNPRFTSLLGALIIELHIIRDVFALLHKRTGELIFLTGSLKQAFRKKQFTENNRISHQYFQPFIKNFVFMKIIYWVWVSFFHCDICQGMIFNLKSHITRITWLLYLLCLYWVGTLSIMCWSAIQKAVFIWFKYGQV